MFQEDLEALGPQKVSDIENAQKDVVNVVKGLEEKGELVIGLGEEDCGRIVFDIIESDDEGSFLVSAGN